MLLSLVDANYRQIVNNSHCDIFPELKARRDRLYKEDYNAKRKASFPQAHVLGHHVPASHASAIQAPPSQASGHQGPPPQAANGHCISPSLHVSDQKAPTSRISDQLGPPSHASSHQGPPFTFIGRQDPLSQASDQDLSSYVSNFFYAKTFMHIQSSLVSEHSRPQYARSHMDNPGQMRSIAPFERLRSGLQKEGAVTAGSSFSFHDEDSDLTWIVSSEPKAPSEL